MRAAEPVVDLWSCNLDAFRLFVALVADWAVDVLPSGARLWRGLPSPAIHAALHLSGHPADRWPLLADDLRLMARAAAEALNEPKR